MKLIDTAENIMPVTGGSLQLTPEEKLAIWHLANYHCQLVLRNFVHDLEAADKLGKGEEWTRESTKEMDMLQTIKAKMRE